MNLIVAVQSPGESSESGMSNPRQVVYEDIGCASDLVEYDLSFGPLMSSAHDADDVTVLNNVRIESVSPWIFFEVTCPDRVLVSVWLSSVVGLSD